MELPEDRIDPSTTRLTMTFPGRTRVVEIHRAAVENGDRGYIDPATDLWVWSALYLWERGTCCDAGCRHCPYTERV